jgi:hypothetical protein
VLGEAGVFPLGGSILAREGEGDQPWVIRTPLWGRWLGNPANFVVPLVIRSAANTTTNYEDSSSRRYLSHRALAALRAVSS